MSLLASLARVRRALDTTPAAPLPGQTTLHVLTGIPDAALDDILAAVQDARMIGENDDELRARIGLYLATAAWALVPQERQ
jgi:hypothetical protein